MLSSFILKNIAVVSMLIDHAGVMLSYAGVLRSQTLYYTLRSIGRAAFPLFAFFLVIGFEKTRDRAKYLTRLCKFAVISQLPFSFATFRSNYSGSGGAPLFFCRADLPLLIVLALIIAAYFLEGKERKLLPLFASAVAAIAVGRMTWRFHGCTLLYKNLNIFYTLACSLAVIWVLDLLRDRKEYSTRSLIIAAVVCAAVCAILIKDVDYGWRGLLLIVMLYLFRGSTETQALMTALWGAVVYLGISLSAGAYLGYLAGNCLAAVGILLYSGEQGRKSRVFYYIYPVHLAVFGAICMFALNG